MNTRQRVLIAALTLYAILVCILDVVSPLGIEVWVLNLPVFIVPILFRNKRMVLVASLGCSLLIIVGGVLSPPGTNPRYWDVINRGMGLVAVWTIAGMVINTIKNAKQLDEAVRRLQLEIALHDKTSRSLELSEERLRLAVEGAGMGTFDVNLQSGTVYWSATHLRMLGYEATSGRETPLSELESCVYSDDRDRIREARGESLRNRSLYSVEHRIVRVDNGAIVWLAVFGRWYYNEAGEGVRFLGVSFDITPRKELERQLLELTAQTQRHIGQELHDSVGQELTGLGLMAQTLSQRLAESGAEQRLAVRLVAGLDQLHQQIRALARGLIPVEMEAKGLWAALDDLAASTSEQSGVSVRFECPEWLEMPDHAISLELYRIAQEAVSNALRHGRPRQIHLSIRTQANGLCLRIWDDGVGIAERPKQSKGLGIRIMEYRAALIGGILRIRPGEEGGTVVTATLPWRKDHDHEESSGSVLTHKKDPHRG